MDQPRDGAGRFGEKKRSEVEIYLDERAEKARVRFERDVDLVCSTYRSDASYLDDDYIGSANLSLLAYGIAETSGDESLILDAEDASEVLDEDPSDVVARDACARIVRDYRDRRGR